MERDEWLRAACRVTVAEEIDARRLVFVDEMGTNTSLSPLRAWSPKGQRAQCSVLRNRGANTTLLSSMTMSSMTMEGGHGTIACRGGSYHRCGLRDLCGAGSLTHAMVQPF